MRYFTTVTHFSDRLLIQKHHAVVSPRSHAHKILHLPLSSRQPIKISSRVPAYQIIEIIDGVLRLFVCILPLRGGLGGANISLLLSLCQRK